MPGGGGGGGGGGLDKTVILPSMALTFMDIDLGFSQNKLEATIISRESFFLWKA